MNKIVRHPVLLHAEDIKTICRPLDALNISYFAHVNIDNDGRFSAISNNPEFHKHYLQHSYYHADIHLSEIGSSSNYVIWDMLECAGETEQMNVDAYGFGIHHTFTIIDKNASGDNFYHFSTHIKEASFNQNYLSNLDLLNMFINHFNDKIGQSKELTRSYQIKFSINQNNALYEVNDGEVSLRNQRVNFLRDLSLPTMATETDAKRLLKNSTILIHKDTHLAVPLYRQQMKCLILLMEGNTARETAAKLNLSHRTISHYLENLRIKLGCRSSKELIAAYYSQVMNKRQLIIL